MRLLVFCSCLCLLFQTFRTEKPEDVPTYRIVGGYQTGKNQLPYQVSLRIRNRHICGGTIISPNYVLTAAHCVTKRTGNVETVMPAYAFSIRTGSIYSGDGGQLMGISEILVHPDYKDYNNDIAILTVSKPIQFSRSVRAIPLAWRSPPVEAKVLISGWGYTTENGRPSWTLKHNVLSVLSLMECKNTFSFVNDGILCLSHALDNGICDGDSGGPAVYQKRLVGVANFALGCGRSAPDGFADVFYFRSWIVENTDLI